MSEVISFQVENWTNVKEEASSLWAAHYDEVGQNKIKMQLNPDISKLDGFNSKGMLHIVTARSAGTLVGYHASFVDTLIHYKHILAGISDLYWLHPDYRKGSTGIKLFKEVEHTLKLRGVQIIYDSVKLYLDHGKLFEHLGYTPIERKYSKWIGN